MYQIYTTCGFLCIRGSLRLTLNYDLTMNQCYDGSKVRRRSMMIVGSGDLVAVGSRWYIALLEERYLSIFSMLADISHR